MRDPQARRSSAGLDADNLTHDALIREVMVIVGIQGVTQTRSVAPLPVSVFRPVLNVRDVVWAGMPGDWTPEAFEADDGTVPFERFIRAVA